MSTEKKGFEHLFTKPQEDLQEDQVQSFEEMFAKRASDRK